ncbi:MAG: tRNA1(Val) (adenine(37)-N6)-methyltransferase [Thermodesulfovibrio sp.]|uniref:Methyltransferase n=1 Tax=Thermodesulfovibrio obliviosus TaxID=3118332 RepID=A0AAU8H4F4_9BACT
MQYTIDSIGSIKICQPEEGYRFSVDALILAHFVNLKRVKKALDIGAGTGIIGIILAKKYPEAYVTMIEIQPDLAVLARISSKLNNVEDRVRILCADAKEFNDSGYDCVISNPPFRRPGTGKMSPLGKRALARHELSLTVKDISQVSQRALKHRGRLYMIHLPERLTEIIKIMDNYSLEVKRVRFVHSKINAEAKMVLIEAVKGGKSALKVEPPLFIYREDGKYTEEMELIYKL